MHIARRRCLRCVDVRMRIDPDQPHHLSQRAKMVGYPGHRARGHRVVPAQHDRCRPARQRLLHAFGNLLVALGDFFQKPRMCVAAPHRLRHRHLHVAAIGNRYAPALRAWSPAPPRAMPTAPYPRRAAVVPGPAAHRSSQSASPRPAAHAYRAPLPPLPLPDSFSAFHYPKPGPCPAGPRLTEANPPDTWLPRGLS